MVRQWTRAILEVSRSRTLGEMRLVVQYLLVSAAGASSVAERLALPVAPIDASVMDRAVQVAGGLARTGRHGGAKPADLVIAAAAEAAGLSVLHYDSDYTASPP